MLVLPAARGRRLTIELCDAGAALYTAVCHTVAAVVGDPTRCGGVSLSMYETAIAAYTYPTGSGPVCVEREGSVPLLGRCLSVCVWSVALATADASWRQWFCCVSLSPISLLPVRLKGVLLRLWPGGQQGRSSIYGLWAPPWPPVVCAAVVSSVSAPQAMMAGGLVGWFGNKTCVVSSISFLCVVTAARRWRV